MFIGQIVAPSGIASDKWLALTKSHKSLAIVPPGVRMGINPFTRQPCEFKTPASTALVQEDRTKIGSIYWAMDGSPILIVDAEEDSMDTAARIAEEIAASLGGQFVRQPNGE